MKKPVAKIGLFLVLIIVLPTLFFSAYEIGNMSQNEQMIDSIYASQLESVMFSINQYADDQVSGWAWEIEYALNNSEKQQDTGIQDFLQFNAAVDYVFLTDSSQLLKGISKINMSDSIGNHYKSQVYNAVVENSNQISKLLAYFKSGYRKIESFPVKITGKRLLLFAVKNQDTDQSIAGIVIDKEKFVKENLGPKIQMVAQDKLFIAVFDADSSSQVYSTELFTPSDLNIEHKKALWLLPGFEIGIQLIGETVEDLIKTRTYFNVMLILIMDIVLIFGVWFVYRSVRQEVKLAQLKSDFVSNVSHEIRTPLAVINMYAETLEMDRIKSEDKKKEYYKVIHTEANRLSAMVNKILNFSKIESGKRDYRFANIDINEVVGHVIQTYQHHFDHHGFECNFEKGNDLPQVNADKEAITEAIINLVDNAMKYSAGKKRIEIRAFLQKGMVGIEIKDYGIGIDDKEKKLIFDKFYRVTKGDLAHKAKGSGIGLNIVKHIMDAHQGSVSLKSTPGQGSIFTLYLPVK